MSEADYRWIRGEQGDMVRVYVGPDILPGFKVYAAIQIELMRTPTADDPRDTETVTARLGGANTIGITVTRHDATDARFFPWVRILEVRPYTGGGVV